MQWGKKLLLLFVLLIVVVGCSSNDTDEDTENDAEGSNTDSEVQVGGELKIAYSAQPATIDPHMTTAVATSDIMRGVYETLVTVDEDQNFQPMLAESYDISEDGLIYTFNLRQGVTFHNGKEMKAEDVVASMKRWQELSTNGRAQFAEATFEEVDEYTVEMVLPNPLSTALSVLTSYLGSAPVILPKEIIENAPDAGIDEHIGTGPFKFVEWRQDAHIQLTRNDDYQARDEEASGLAGKKEALVDDVYFYFVTDASTRLAGMLSGEYDMAHAIAYDNVPQLEAADNIDIHIVPGSTQVLTFNQKKGVFSDIRAREAVRAALSLDEMMQAAFGDEKYYTINHNLVMPHLEGQFYSEFGKETHNQNDVEKGKQIIEEAGLEGEEVVILSTRDYEEVYNASIVVQERLEQIGLSVRLDVVDWPTFLEKKEDENGFDINIVGFGPQPEPTSYLFVGKGPHSGWMDDDEFHDLVAEFRNQPTLEDTKDIYDEMMKWLEEDIAFIKVADYNRVNVSQKLVKNVHFLDGFITWNISKEQ
ncbi:ABC transporter substrate-binding protein [Ornithinibacillus sp. 4-3]|uniref:ABC transporter substrate-binding protein n=1 Tax=Ornithinibacillus sp. 4-3 TaxID=3231488 RepID=A0AB39HQM3_9BACI